jgi:endonuclease/exonuclease/phosphatase family metal-dependent hydrolase
VLTSFVLLTFFAAATQPPEASLRVMTFNIHAGHSDLARTADVIRTSKADIVALQEVDVHWGERSGFEDQATALSKATGMDVRFGPIYRLPGDASGAPKREFGVAILSRFPITSSRNHAITRLSTQGGQTPQPMPGFLQVTVQSAAGAVDVFSTHLDYRPDPAVRRTQVADMLAIVRTATNPVVLMGDLNAPPDAPELRPLFEALDDAWQGRDDVGGTYPAAAPARRIDYVLAGRRIRVRRAQVIATDASDHLPVVADLEIGPMPTPSSPTPP